MSVLGQNFVEMLKRDPSTRGALRRMAFSESDFVSIKDIVYPSGSEDHYICAELCLDKLREFEIVGREGEVYFFIAENRGRDRLKIVRDEAYRRAILEETSK